MSPTSESRRKSELIRVAWERGHLRWLLNSNQKRVYDQYRQWEQQDPTTGNGQFRRVFVLDIGRRYGKTTLRFMIRCEDCIRTPGRIYRYASAFQKNIDEIVNDVSRYVLATCPDDLRPQYVKSAQKFVFKNGSEIRLVGLDLHPDGLRGQACDGDDLSEAAFIKHLRYTIKNVLYPQYQGRPHARICLESSAPVESESDYDDVFVEDAKNRGAYVFRTIDDNPRLPPAERQEFIDAAGGRDHVDCRREYYNERVRDPEGSVVPEFVLSRHVCLSEVPRYAHCYVGSDPGTRDKFGMVFGYWDWKRQKLVIQRSWAERNAGTSQVADFVRSTELELHWPQYWDGRELQSNPYRRYSDTDARVILDLRVDHSLKFVPTDKAHAKAETQAGSGRRLPEAKLYSLRNAFLNDRIEIWPDSGPLASALNAGRWNEQRTDFERTDAHGHLDVMMALVYLWEGVKQHRNLNPNKPDILGNEENIFNPPWAPKPQQFMVGRLNQAFGANKFKTKPVRPGRTAGW